MNVFNILLKLNVEYSIGCTVVDKIYSLSWINNSLYVLVFFNSLQELILSNIEFFISIGLSFISIKALTFNSNRLKFLNTFNGLNPVPPITFTNVLNPLLSSFKINDVIVFSPFL